jgi:hypothetical protein
VRARDQGGELSFLAEKARLLTQQGEQAGLALEPLAVELLDVRDLLRDQLGLAAVGIELARVAIDLEVELLDALVEDCLAVGIRGAARLELVGLGTTNRGDIGVVRSGQDRVREFDLRDTRSLRDQARLRRRQRPKAFLEPADLGAGINPLEDDERLTHLDDVPVAHPQLTDDAALQMLDGAPAAFRADDTGRDRRAGQRRDRRPADAEAEHQQQRERTPEHRHAQVGENAPRQCGARDVARRLRGAADEARRARIHG